MSRFIEKVETKDSKSSSDSKDSKSSNNSKDSKSSNDSKDLKNPIANKCVDIFKQQLCNTKNINELLHLACMMDNVELVRYLISNDSIDVNAYKITSKIN